VPKPSRLRQALEQTRNEAKRLAREARQTAAATGSRSSVRYAGRHNVVVAGNTGESDASQSVVAVQHAPIQQDGRRS
jgi:hypothetical protein